MNNILLYRAGFTEAIRWAGRFLCEQGIPFSEQPCPEVTHLLLPVPSFEPDGRIKGGGILEHLLADLPQDICVIGGNLEHPALTGHRKLDLLRDGLYTAKNGAITADCAIRVAGGLLPTVFADCPVLIIGWGRIGKCLAKQLQAMGANVTVAARKESDRHMIQALGCYAVDSANLKDAAPAYRLIFNTVPAPVLPSGCCRANCIQIELASQPGLGDANAVKALGLPGKMVPEASGKLIAQTILRHLERTETL